MASLLPCSNCADFDKKKIAGRKETLDDRHLAKDFVACRHFIQESGSSIKRNSATWQKLGKVKRMDNKTKIIPAV
jgi:hypothetical protein